jgi:predicted metal-binding membrane protein
MTHTLVEAVLRRTRLTLVLVLVVVPLGCWIWVVAMARDMYGAMSGSAAWMMTPVWDARHVILLWAMWAAMMAGMMLPPAAPIVLLYASALRNRQDDGDPSVRIYALAAGYILIWAAFSVGATIVQRLLAARLILTPMMEPAAPAVAGVLLIGAGIYQLTPLKQVCLQYCRSPVGFLGSHWREGVAGAFRMGLDHGLHCLGCCWALMLLLFAGGVMNLTAILALTAWVAIEKVAPFGDRSARVAGAVLLGLGAWMVLG